MIRVPYDTNRQYDAGLQCLIDTIKFKTTSEKHKDDFLLMCVSETGGGKSMLMLHILENYLGDEASIDYVGLNKASFANALSKASKKELPRFLANDEANISKRDSITKYNKKIIDLYFSIRGIRMFHWWNNPSLDIVDKVFIEERLKGVIYIPYKMERMRIYYYFEDKKIIEIFQKYKVLKLHILKKVAKTHSKYRGWFRDYKGHLLEPYNKMKDSRMEDKVTAFCDEYSESDKTWMRMGKFTTVLGVSRQTVLRHTKVLEKEGKLTEDVYKFAPNGERLFRKEAIQIFYDHSQKLKDAKRKRMAEYAKNLR